MWNRVDTGLPRHRKLRQLVAQLGLREGALTQTLKLTPEATAVGLLVSLWLETRINAPDGTLRRWTADDVAFAAGVVPGSFQAAALVDALVAARLLDQTPDGYHVHNWETRNGEHLRRAKNKQAERERERTGAANGREGSDSSYSSTSTSTSSLPVPSPARRRPVAGTSPSGGGDSAGMRHLGGIVQGLVDGLGGPASDGEAESAEIAQHGPRAAPGASPEKRPRPVEDVLEELGLKDGEAKTAAQLGHRLLGLGIGPATATEAMRLFVERSRTGPPIGNAFAYFNPGATGFEALRERLGARWSEREGEYFKKLERGRTAVPA